MECTQAAPQARSDAIPVPMFISDTMDAVKSMADGKYYDSKSAIRAGYKAGGYVEVGNDTSHLKPRQETRPDPAHINDAVEKAVARFERGERITA
jgi:hypothetical protein